MATNIIIDDVLLFSALQSSMEPKKKKNKAVWHLCLERRDGDDKFVFLCRAKALNIRMCVICGLVVGLVWNYLLLAKIVCFKFQMILFDHTKTSTIWKKDNMLEL